LINPKEIAGWINGNLYLQTSESLGILRIPSEIQHASGMGEFSPSVDRNQKHGFLAELHGTRKPVLPVHTKAEKELFHELMKGNSEFNALTGPNWKNAMKVWNHHADTDCGIYYKVPIFIFIQYPGTNLA
jgi:hypothetical protein